MPVPRVKGTTVHRGNSKPAKPAMPKKIRQGHPKVGKAR